VERGADRSFADRVITFFEAVQRLDDETLHLGHAYFQNCVDEEKARQAWEFRLRPFFKKACRLDAAMLATVVRHWLRVCPPVGAGEATTNEKLSSEASGEI
jgi:5-methylcytosine-specific restriction protein B